MKRRLHADIPPSGDAASWPLAPRIVSLSEDLLINIIRDDCISRGDVISLRLTCIALSRAATAVLFHRIRISQLWRDRDAFLSICHSPHLAQHVREVEWQEVSWFPGYFSLVHQDDTQSLDHDIREICDQLDTLSVDLFWLPAVPYESAPDREAIESQRNKAVEKFRDEFQHALSQLRRLGTAVSRPMPPDRLIDWCEHSISVNLFRTHLERANMSKSRKPQTSDGLFLFLLPTMEFLAPSITRLVWEDESLTGWFLHQPCPTAFKHIRTLDITLSRGAYHESYDNLATNLKAATNVRDLSLCQVNEGHNLFLERAMLQFSSETRETGWSRLNSLSLKSMRLGTESLADVVKSNASTLRHLHLSNCQLRVGQIKLLVEIPKLRLASFCVHDDGFTQAWVAEETVLSFLNQPYRDHFYHPFSNRISMFTDDQVFATVLPATDDDYVDTPDDDVQSVCSDHSLNSEDNTGYHFRTGPKWIWGRYFNKSASGDIYCYQVPDSHPNGQETVWWKFTCRHGRVAFGVEPLDWFEDWDTELGDVEQPMPYCPQLRSFASQSRLTGMDEFLGARSTAWETLHSLTPPEGAILYNKAEDNYVGGSNGANRSQWNTRESALSGWRRR